MTTRHHSRVVVALALLGGATAFLSVQPRSAPLTVVKMSDDAAREARRQALLEASQRAAERIQRLQGGEGY